jgi:hypothetical protein
MLDISFISDSFLVTEISSFWSITDFFKQDSIRQWRPDILSKFLLRSGMQCYEFIIIRINNKNWKSDINLNSRRVGKCLCGATYFSVLNSFKIKFMDHSYIPTVQGHRHV